MMDGGHSTQINKYTMPDSTNSINARWTRSTPRTWGKCLFAFRLCILSQVLSDEYVSEQSHTHQAFSPTSEVAAIFEKSDSAVVMKP